MKLVSLTCEFCHRQFDRALKIHKSRTKNGYRNFCDLQCRGGYKSENETHTQPCGHCGKSVSRVRSQATKSKSGHVFCDASCAAKYNNAHKTHGTRRSKLEVWLEQRLRELYPNLTILCNRTDAINAELDIYFPELKLAFELNGIFHYEPVYGPEKLASIQTNDHRKFAACSERGISLCVIDTSSMMHFKPTRAQQYLDIITRTVDGAR